MKHTRLLAYNSLSFLTVLSLCFYFLCMSVVSVLLFVPVITKIVELFPSVFRGLLYCFSLG